MSILRRQDGAQFVLQPYREWVTLQSTALLKKEALLLAEDYGSYCRIFRQGEKQFEAIFAHDPGQLLGETVWQYFDKPQDLFYCEALTDEFEEALVVVVRKGIVHLDAQIAYKNFVEELAGLQVGDAAFAAYIYGNVPISVHPEPGKYTLPTDKVNSFTELTTPVFAHLPTPPAFSLVTVDQAVADLKLNRQAYIITAVTLAFLVLILLWAYWPKEPINLIDNAPVDPWTSYRAALSTPEPSKQLQELTEQIIKIYGVPGWLPTRVKYSQTGGQFEVHSLGGSVRTLLNWATEQRSKVVLNNNGAIVTFSSNLAKRAHIHTVQNGQQAVATLIDKMMQIIPTKSVQVLSPTLHEVYNDTAVVLTVTNIAPDTFILISQALTDLPVTLSACNFVLANGLLSGTIQLNLLGN